MATPDIDPVALPSRNLFDGVSVFSATKFGDRERLGERVTRWLRDHPDLEVVKTVVTLSSDAEFHCLALTLFWRAGTGSSKSAPRTRLA
ncbi:MAG TPA: hypothetical protein VMT47_02110 [Polyangia bacterium]|nr:hypothetical protein [Polyangia bacterium]